MRNEWLQTFGFPGLIYKPENFISILLNINVAGAGRAACAAGAALIAAAVQSPVDVEVLHKPGFLLVVLRLGQVVVPEDLRKLTVRDSANHCAIR